MNKWFLTCMLGLAACGLEAQTPDQSSTSLREGITAVDQSSEDFAARRADLRAAGVDLDALAVLDAATDSALRFLYAYMPWPDVADYSTSYYIAQTQCALRARAEMPWGKKVPRREWLHFVLPVRVNNENLDTFRTAMYDELKQRVQGLSMRDAVLEVNHWCHEYVTYKPSDARTSSPLASMRTATGRCGEESTFTVAALRAIGIPARQVYTPRWAHTDDNHAWVEAWVDGKWYFLGACEPEPVLNLGWFNQPASRGMLMHTKVYGRYDGPEDVISRTPCYTEINVTSNYAPVARQSVMVLDANGKPVADADVEFKLYNYAELYTVMHTRTDSEGKASITAGLGDLVAWAAKDGRYGLTKFTVGATPIVKVQLTHSAGEAFELDLNITPPAGQNNVPQLPAEAVVANDRRKAHEDSIRTAYVATFADSLRTAEFCEAQGLDYATVRPYVEKSKGNWANVFSFLTRATEKEKQLAFDLLSTLSEKDLRDFDLAVLNDHFDACRGARIQPKADLGVRIANEGLTPWRSYFRKAFSQSAQERFRVQPAALAAWIRDSVETDDVWNPQNYCLSPEAAHATRRADSRSKGLLFVAAARALGIPARIDAVTGKVQYRLIPADASIYDGTWTTVTLTAEGEKRAHQLAAHLTLDYTPRPHMENPGYYYHFTLSRLVDGRPVLQEYGETDTWRDDFADGVSLDAADYLLTSGTRMADGSVLAHLSVFPVQSGEQCTAQLEMREDTARLQVIGNFNSENLYTDATTAREQSVLATTGRGYFVVGLIRANHEPSNHILHDLEKLRDELEAWGRPIVLMFPTQDELDRFNQNRAEFTNLPSTLRFGVDSSGQVGADLFGSGLTSSTEMPVIVLGDTFNRVVFMTQGYTIGIGEQIKQALQKL